MFNRHLRRCGRAFELKRTDVIVLDVLQAYGGWGKRRIFPNLGSIARRCYCSVRTVQRALGRLRKAGLLVVDANFEKLRSGRWRQTSNVYQFTALFTSDPGDNVSSQKNTYDQKKKKGGLWSGPGGNVAPAMQPGRAIGTKGPDYYRLMAAGLPQRTS